MRIINFVITLVFLACSSFLFGQSNEGFVYATTNEDGSAVWLKWFVNYSIEDGSTVWRRGPSSSNWERLTDEPIMVVSKDLTLPEGDENEIALLMAQEYAQEDLDTIPGVLELIYAVEMVRNQKFCEYIGRFYEDKTANYGETYEYKVTTGKTDRIIGISEPVIALPHRPIEPVQEVKWETDADIDTLLRMGWMPEEARYFGVNIYRTEPDTEVQNLLNDLYIFPSLKVEAGMGADEYQEWFYSNDKHEKDKTYIYELETVDFFGRPGKRTEPIEIRIEDKRPISPPDAWDVTKSDAKEVYVHWVIPEDDRLVGYNIYQRHADGDTVLVNTKVIPANLDSYTLSVDEYGSYFYTVETISKNGYTAITAEKGINILDVEPPLVPQDIQISVDTGLLKINWTANVEADLNGYIVFRGVRDDFTEPFIRLTHKPIKEPYYEDKVTERAKNKFSYKIAAIDTSFNMSELTEPLSAFLPDVTPPVSPVITAADADSLTVRVTWLPVLTEDDDLAGYRLLRAIDDKTEITVAESLSKTAETYTDTELEAGNAYSYRLQAYDETGNVSEYSNVFTVRIKSTSIDNSTLNKFNVNYQKKKNRAVLKWKIEDNRPVKGSVVFRQIGEGRMLALTPLLTNVLTHYDNELQPDQSYVYRVKTYYLDGSIGVTEDLTVEIPASDN